MTLTGSAERKGTLKKDEEEEERIVCWLLRGSAHAATF